MKPSRSINLISQLLGLIGALSLMTACSEADKEPRSPPQSAKAALSVNTTTPQMLDWPLTFQSNGNIAAWQEAVIGPELNNYRITEVQVNVSDVVKKGQVLARIAADTVTNELAESVASVAEAEAVLAEARANLTRAQQLREKGFYSEQQNTQSQTAADTALARLNASKARLQTARLILTKANVLAPDDGIISARTATVGTLTQPGQELFRLIRGGRLEWRAEVTSAELSRFKPGQVATLSSPNGDGVEGVVRAIAPTVDPQTRTALVYVDLPKTAARVLSAGMFARGEFRLGQHSALTLPQSAVILREGFAYVFRVEHQGNTDKVIQTKIGVGRRNGDRIEVSGLDAQAQIVASGAGFLADGDTVRLVPAPKSTLP
jgi:RND family efflux transporter MFP subunit